MQLGRNTKTKKPTEYLPDEDDDQQHIDTISPVTTMLRKTETATHNASLHESVLSRRIPRRRFYLHLYY